MRLTALDKYRNHARGTTLPNLGTGTIASGTITTSPTAAEGNSVDKSSDGIVDKVATTAGGSYVG